MKYDLRKVLLFFLMLVLPAFIFKEYHVLKSARESYVSTPAPVVLREQIDHRFVFVIVANDRADFAIKALSSILSQDYERYRIVLVDNHVQDGSFQGVQTYLFKKHAFRKNITIIRHQQQQPFGKILKEVLKDCESDEIAVLLNPSDWLAHQGALTAINEAYSDPEVWLTYPASLEYPSYRKKPLNPQNIKAHIRKPYRTPWMESGMRTFYVHMMQNMNFDENLDEHELFMPMINLAKWHIRYIPDTLYIQNRLKMHNASTRMQMGLRLDELTKSIHTQSHLARAGEIPISANTKADMILFSTNQPFQLGVSLESVYRYVRGVDQIHVMYDTASAHKQAYEDLKKRYPKVIFREQDALSSEFKPMLMSLLKDTSNQNAYIVLATDRMLIKDPIYLQDCTNALSQTKAFAFFLDNQAISIAPNSNSVSNRIHIIEIEPAKIAEPFNMVIYSRADIIQELDNLDFKNPKSLLKSWSQHSDTRRLGLFYDACKVSMMH